MLIDHLDRNRSNTENTHHGKYNYEDGYFQFFAHDVVLQSLKRLREGGGALGKTVPLLLSAHYATPCG
jgi:hypothetical protein